MPKTSEDEIIRGQVLAVMFISFALVALAYGQPLLFVTMTAGAILRELEVRRVKQVRKRELTEVNSPKESG